MTSTVAERYELATETSDLTLAPGRCDADVLLAAAYAAQGNVRGQQALALYRIKISGDRAGLRGLVSMSAGWLLARSRKGGREQLHRTASGEIASQVLTWWLDDRCPHCEGRRYELVPGTQITSERLCHVCDGHGKPPVESRLRKTWREPGRWLASEFDTLLSYVIGDMAKRLRPSLELATPDQAAVDALQETLADLRSTAAAED